MKVEVYVTLKKAILDPQGKALANSLNRLGFDEVQDVRVGKLIEMEINETDATMAKQRVQTMCDQLLINPVIENVRYEFKK